MITYLAKEGFTEATYARAARVSAFTGYLTRRVPGSVAYFTHIGGSSISLARSSAALLRLLKSLHVTWSAANPWVVVDYPNFPASVPRRLPVYAVASLYLAALQVICRLRGSRLVLQSDDDPALQDQWLGIKVSPWQLALERRFGRRLYRCADRIWFSGESSAALLCRLFDVPIAKAVYVPNGADPPPPASPPDLAIGGLFRFAYTGSLHAHSHGVEGLINAFREVRSPDARLVLAGPDGDWIPGYLDDHQDHRVRYMGRLTSERVQALLSQCDAGMLTGTRGGYHDTGFPSKLGAYLAAGLPVVSTVGGDAELVIERRHVGVLCDEAALGDEMNRLVEDERHNGSLRWRAEAIKSDYLWDHIYGRAVSGLTPSGETRRPEPRLVRPDGSPAGWQGEGAGE